MRYSARLADGSELTWTDGSPVEGYSNLLWVLLTAAGMSFGIDGVDTVRLLGILSITCFVFCVLFTYRRNLSKKPLLVLPLAILSAPLGACYLFMPLFELLERDITEPSFLLLWLLFGRSI